MNEPLPVPSTAIYSRSDGVVAWHSCIDEEAPRRREHPGAGQPHRPPAQPGGAVRHRRSPGPGARRARAVPAAGVAAAVRQHRAVAAAAEGRSRAMTRMRAMDAAFLAMERPAEPRHLGSVSIFGPGPDGPLTYDVVRALLEERLALIRSARRVVVERPARARPAVVGPEPRASTSSSTSATTPSPPPGGAAELADLVARAHALPLDRSRPLWELWVIDGLADGRVALYAKIHMAAIDDVTGAEVMTALLDPDPTGDAPRAAATAGGPTPERRRAAVRRRRPTSSASAAGFPGRLANRAASDLGGQLAGLGETIVETVQRTPGLDRDRPAAAGTRPTARSSTRARPGRAPRVSWNAPVTAHRRFAMTRLPLDRVIAIKRAAGTTVNDVVVAVCAGALRHWLDAHDELPTSPIVAMVPMLVGGDRPRRRPRRRARRAAADERRRAGRAAAPHERRARRGQAAPRRGAGVADAGRVDVRPAGAVGARPAASSARCRTARWPARPSTWRSPTCPARASRCTSPGARWRRATRCSRSTSCRRCTSGCSRATTRSTSARWPAATRLTTSTRSSSGCPSSSTSSTGAVDAPARDVAASTREGGPT